MSSFICIVDEYENDDVISGLIIKVKSLTKNKTYYEYKDSGHVIDDAGYWHKIKSENFKTKFYEQLIL